MGFSLEQEPVDKAVGGEEQNAEFSLSSVVGVMIPGSFFLYWPKLLMPLLKSVRN